MKIAPANAKVVAAVLTPVIASSVSTTSPME